MGAPSLIFHFRGRFRAISATGRSLRQPACFVVGLLTSPFVIAPAAHVDTMGVRFRPGGAYPFFRGPLSALTDRAVVLDDLMGRATARRLWQQLAEMHLAGRSGPAADAGLARRSGEAAKAAGDAARVSAISRELLHRLCECRTPIAPPRRPSAISSAPRGVRASTRVAARAGMTTRHLQRRFADRVGVSPKVLARILRFQRTLLQRAAADRVAAPTGCALLSTAATPIRAT